MGDSPTLDFDTTALRVLAADLDKVPGKAVERIGDAVGEAAADLLAGWFANARRTAGRHGKWYPYSITATKTTTIGAISADVGPQSDRLQGGMGRGFEYGSVNQPPHLDGNKAADTVLPGFIAAVTQAATDAVGDAL